MNPSLPWIWNSSETKHKSRPCTRIPIPVRASSPRAPADVITARSESPWLVRLPNLNDVYRYVEMICYPNRAFENSFTKTEQIIWTTGL